ncbi:putative carboxylesterase 12 [Silene latifolia]|uniref:putative carboxylesterase 12 n=1 Tax=Silene latifolia TaxID=37657 RepID=UPI003D77C519
MEEMMKELMKAIGNVNQEDILHDFRPLLVVYKDGRVQKFLGHLTVPPSIDGLTGVESKDVVVSSETGVYVRMYKPQGIKSNEKVPLLVYIHGGGFVVETASSLVYHSHLNVLSSKANVIVVSVDYRTAPEYPLPAAYDDSWAALHWVRSGLAGAEPWLSQHVDPARVFLAGDSAGGNIAHNMAKRLAKSNTDNIIPDDKIALKGLVLIHPFFWGKDRIGSEPQKMEPTTGLTSGRMTDMLWKFAHPDSTGSDDPLINPGMDPELGELAGEKVLVFVAEQDELRDRGFHYKEMLVKSGWKGDVQVVETHGENHLFHLVDPVSANAAVLMDQFVAFINSS